VNASQCYVVRTLPILFVYVGTCKLLSDNLCFDYTICIVILSAVSHLREKVVNLIQI